MVLGTTALRINSITQLFLEIVFKVNIAMPLCPSVKLFLCSSVQKSILKIQNRHFFIIPTLNQQRPEYGNRRYTHFRPVVNFSMGNCRRFCLNTNGITHMYMDMDMEYTHFYIYKYVRLRLLIYLCKYTDRLRVNHSDG